MEKRVKAFFRNKLYKPHLAPKEYGKEETKRVLYYDCD